MKKVLVFVLLSFVLLGCTPKETAKRAYLETPSKAVEVCTDDCETDQSMVLVYFDYYSELLSSLKQTALNTPSAYPDHLMAGTSYAREDIPRVDPLTGNPDIPLYVPYDQMSSFFGNVKQIVENCPESGPCDTWVETPSTTPIEYEYGFSQTNGHISYSLGTNGTVKVMVDLSFCFDEDSFSYYYVRRLPENGSFDAFWLSDGIYQRLFYWSEESYIFQYIDVVEKDFISYEHNMDDYIVFQHYDPETGVFYRSINSNYHEIKRYLDDEFVASMLPTQNLWMITLDMFSLPGWDTLGFGVLDEIYSSQVTLEGEPAYMNYSITAGTVGLRYYNIMGILFLPEEDLSTYEFPEGFTGGFTFQELKADYDDFSNIEDPLTLIGLTKDAILAKLHEIQDGFEE